MKEYPSVYQNFIKDIYEALNKGKYLLDNYEKLVLIYPAFIEQLGMKTGFEKFCNDCNVKHEIINQFTKRTIQKGEVYIIPDDRDLVNVIEQSRLQDLKLGFDFGIISYNETPLKKVVENGITTISTDFKMMGYLLAKMILEGSKEQIENKNTLIIRNSI